ncbi:MAG: amidohydrolase family protein, partial [Actinotalea sp.]|nr:amidohydrolase family protein [Actinotalea sp.]
LAVLRSATSEAADWLDPEVPLGRLVPGAAADLLLLDADPVPDVSALRGLHAVVRDGRVARDDRGTLAALGRP